MDYGYCDMNDVWENDYDARFDYECDHGFIDLDEDKEVQEEEEDN